MPAMRQPHELEAASRGGSAGPGGSASRREEDVNEEPEPPGRLTLDVIEDHEDWSRYPTTLPLIALASDAIARQSTALPPRPAVATVVLSSDDAVRALNLQWRGQDKPTNVLSFPSAGIQHAGQPALLGDVILAMETLEREAEAMGIPFAHHLQHLVVHGVLHLAGFDHENANDAERMEALERKILASLSVPDPYAESDPIAEDGTP